MENAISGKINLFKKTKALIPALIFCFLALGAFIGLLFVPMYSVANANKSVYQYCYDVINGIIQETPVQGFFKTLFDYVKNAIVFVGFMALAITLVVKLIIGIVKACKYKQLATYSLSKNYVLVSMFLIAIFFVAFVLQFVFKESALQCVDLRFFAIYLGIAVLGMIISGVCFKISGINTRLGSNNVFQVVRLVLIAVVFALICVLPVMYVSGYNNCVYLFGTTTPDRISLILVDQPLVFNSGLVQITVDTYKGISEANGIIAMIIYEYLFPIFALFTFSFFIKTIKTLAFGNKDLGVILYKEFGAEVKEEDYFTKYRPDYKTSYSGYILLLILSALVIVAHCFGGMIANAFNSAVSPMLIGTGFIAAIVAAVVSIALIVYTAMRNKKVRANNTRIVKGRLDAISSQEAEEASKAEAEAQKEAEVNEETAPVEEVAPVETVAPVEETTPVEEVKEEPKEPAIEKVEEPTVEPVVAPIVAPVVASNENNETDAEKENMRKKWKAHLKDNEGKDVFCTKCGYSTKMNKDLNFCPQCGADLCDFDFIKGVKEPAVAPVAVTAPVAKKAVVKKPVAKKAQTPATKKPVAKKSTSKVAKFVLPVIDAKRNLTFVISDVSVIGKSKQIAKGKQGESLSITINTPIKVNVSVLFFSAKVATQVVSGGDDCIVSYKNKQLSIVKK